MANTSGNKGAVMLRFQLEDTTFVFVNNHLAAGATPANEIDRATQLDHIVNTGFKGQRETQYQTYEVLNHNVRVFFGDMNFRINLPRKEVLEAVKAKDYRKLMGHDELYRTGMKNNILKTCQEGQLLFDPTYKYDQGSTEYDTSAKRRTPSWTDRVIFSQNMPCLKLTRYGRSEIRVSDHRPVFAQFKASIRKIDEEAKQLVESNLI